VQKTHRSNQLSVYFTWEICVRAPTVKDHLSQFPCLPTHVKVLTRIVYLLDFCAVYVPDSTKRATAVIYASCALYAIKKVKVI
jgi:hypothetical protein